MNVSGTAGGFADRLVNSARSAVNSAFISVASTPVAQAFVPKPQIVSRAAWRADLPSGGCRAEGPAEYGTVQAAVIHHSVNANDYTPEEAPSIVLGICRFHVYGNGWNNIGYNALVDRFGTIYEGRAGGLKRPVDARQAQINSQTTSIASIGDHTSEAPTPQAVRSIIQFLAWKMKIARAIPTTGSVQLTSAGGPEDRYPAGTVITVPRIVGHTTLGLTACPGGAMIPLIPQITAAVQKRIKHFSKGKRKKKKHHKHHAGGVPGSGAICPGKKPSASGPACAASLHRWPNRSQLVCAERRLAVGEATLEVIERVSGGQAAAEVNRQAKLRAQRDHRRKRFFIGESASASSAVPPR